MVHRKQELIHYSMFTNHPDIFIKGGETHLFDKPKKKFDHSTISNYEKSFKTNKTCIGEKTPSYYYLFFAIDRIHNYYPNIKLILILREPISQSIQSIQYELQNCKQIIEKS